MKAAQLNSYGGPEVLQVADAPSPSLSPDHVIVEIKATGVNPADWKMREGQWAQKSPLQFPATLGGDFSGVVTEVGPGVTDYKPGDEVYGSAGVMRGGSGAFAEMASASVGTIAHKIVVQ